MNISTEIKNILSNHLPELKKKYPIAKMALFGSVTRTDYDPSKSDVDILVEFNGIMDWNFFDLEKEIEKIVGKKVDLVSWAALKPHYLKYIAKDIIHV